MYIYNYSTPKHVYLYHLVLLEHGLFHEILAQVHVAVAILCRWRPAPQTLPGKTPLLSVLLAGPVQALTQSHPHALNTLMKRRISRVKILTKILLWINVCICMCLYTTIHVYKWYCSVACSNSIKNLFSIYSLG